MNKDLFFDGKEYISASRASKKLGYSQDYIGELVRKEKVPGKMIGRTWYVELESLLEHKKSQKSKKQKKKENEKPDHSVYLPQSLSPIFLLSKTTLKYEKDQAPELPPLDKSAHRDLWSLRKKVIEETLVGFTAMLIIIASGLHASGYASPQFAQSALDKLADVSQIENKMLASASNAFGGLSEAVNVPGVREVASVWGGVKDFFSGLLPDADSSDEPVRSLVIIPLPTKPSLAQNSVPSAPTQTSVKSTHTPSELESLKNELRGEFKDYVSTHGGGLSPVNYYYPITQLETFRTVEIAKDISHSVRGQGSNNVDNISSIIYQMLNDGSFENSKINHAQITDSSFEGSNISLSGSFSADNASTTSMRTDSLAFLNATGTSATTTNFFSTNGHFDSLFAGTLSVNDGNFTVGSQLNLVQSDNGLTQFYARRATDLAPSGDFITYYNAAGDTALFRVDNSGNIYSGGITNSGSLTVTSVSTPQFRVQYDSSNEVTTSVSSAGAVTFGVNGSTPRIWWAPQSNRTDTFQFQDASGTPLFNVDTLNRRVSIASSTLVVDANGKVGIGGASPLVSLSIFGTDALKLPTGTTAERPTLLNTEIGDIRYNTDFHQFEGYGDNSVWQGLGGVIDTDQDTMITADTGGIDEDALRFFTAGLERMTILANGNIGIGATTPEFGLDLLSATTTQARFGYDANNYLSFSVSSTGTTTLDAIGNGSGFIFSDPISVPGSGTNSQMFGPGTLASAINDLVIGYQSKSSGARNILIGGNDSGVTTTGHDNIQIHPTQSSQAGSAGGSFNVILGGTSGSPDTSSNTLIGYNSSGYSGGTALGANTSALASNGNAIAIGKSSVAIRGEFVAGSDYNGAAGGEITDVYFGSGKTSAAPFDYIIHGSGGSGTNKVGASLLLAGGKGTGSALGGSIFFQTADAGSSGTTLQSLTTKMTILADGNVGIGTTTPSYKLSVVGDAYIGGNLTTTGTSAFQDLTFTNATGTNSTTTNFYSSSLIASNATTTNFFSTTASSTNFFTTSANIGTLTSGLINGQTISSAANFTGSLTMNGAFSNTSASTSYFTGNLGIGTTTPSAKLAITGTAGTGDIFAIASSTNARLLTVTNAGNVGIGTTNPLGLLQIHGAEVAALKTYSGQGNTGGGDAVINTYRLGSGDAYLRVLDVVALGDDVNNRASAIRFLTTNTSGATGERVRIDGSGNVGIGTTDPLFKLHVFNGASAISRIRLGGDGSASNLAYNLALDSTTGNGKLNFEEGTGGAVRMTIQQDGNVGIGTVTPGSKLQVAGEARIDTLGYSTGHAVFGQRQVNISELTDVLFNATSRFTVTGGAAAMFDGSYDTSTSLSASATSVININVAGQSGVPAAGFTYPGGSVYVSFYSATNAYTAIQLRAKQNGTWFTSAAPTDISTSGSYKVLKFDIGSSNFLTDIELSVTTDSSNTVQIAAIEYIQTRWTSEAETPYVSKYLSTNSMFGKLGIGTSTPSATLDVTGAVTNTAYFRTSSTDTTLANLNGGLVNFQNTSATANNSVGMLFRDANGTAVSSILNQTTSHTSHTGSLNFLTNDGSSIQNRMTIGSDGNVGIGASVPAAKLHVQADGTLVNSGSGQIRISGATDSNERLILGYDTTGDYGWIQATHSTVDHKSLILNGLGGNVGIGTTSPGTTLDVLSSSGSIRTSRNINNLNSDMGNITLGGLNSSNAVTGYATIYSYSASNTAGAESGVLHMNVLNAGANTEVMRISNTGSVRFNTYGAGTLTTDASGNITASSDERLKNIQGEFTRSLADLRGINPIIYKWNSTSGYDQDGTYSGFSAQNVQANIPEAIGIDPRGYLTLSDRPITAALVNGVKELDLRTSSTTEAVAGLRIDFEASLTSISDLQAIASSTLARVDALELRVGELENTAPAYGGASSTSLYLGLSFDATTTDAVSESLLASASTGLKNGVVGLGAMIVQVYDSAIYAASGIFDKVFARSVHTDLVCLTDEGGETCVTRANLDALLNSSNQSGTVWDEIAPTDPGTISNGSSTTTSTSTPMTSSSTPAVPADSGTSSTSTPEIISNDQLPISNGSSTPAVTSSPADGGASSTPAV